MDKIKILVAQHKEADVYSNKVYTPIQVGKAVSKVDLGILGDDMGDNISSLNPYYCELTAQYWAWKNLHDVEYIGLCHYRRYFKTEFTEDNIEDEMGNCDMILVRHIEMDESVIKWCVDGLVEEDMYIFIHYLYKRYPEYKEQVDDYFIRGNKCWPCNMFVMKKECFDKFATWQFSILSELRSLIKPSSYSRLNRMMGYFAEHLLHLYAVFYDLKVKEEPIVSMIGDRLELFSSTSFHKIKNNLIFRFVRRKFTWNYAVIAGLKSDGIDSLLS